MCMQVRNSNAYCQPCAYMYVGVCSYEMHKHMASSAVRSLTNLNCLVVDVRAIDDLFRKLPFLRTKKT